MVYPTHHLLLVGSCLERKELLVQFDIFLQFCLDVTNDSVDLNRGNNYLLFDLLVLYDRELFPVNTVSVFQVFKNHATVESQ